MVNSVPTVILEALKSTTHLRIKDMRGCLLGWWCQYLAVLCSTDAALLPGSSEPAEIPQVRQLTRGYLCSLAIVLRTLHDFSPQKRSVL